MIKQFGNFKFVWGATGWGWKLYGIIGYVNKWFIGVSVKE